MDRGVGARLPLWIRQFGGLFGWLPPDFFDFSLVATNLYAKTFQNVFIYLEKSRPARRATSGLMASHLTSMASEDVDFRFPVAHVALEVVVVGRGVGGVVAGGGARFVLPT